MHVKTLYALLVIAILSTGCQPSSPPVKLPFIIDNADLLTPNQQNELGNLYEDFSERTGNKIGLLAIRDCSPEKSLQTFSRKYYNDHGLDEDSAHYNILLVFCSGCHEIQILVGSGPGTVINDSIARDIIRDVMMPALKRDRSYEGLLMGSNAIIARLNAARPY